MVALGVMGAALANEAKGDIILGEIGVQGTYSSPAWNESTLSYITENSINWKNNSEDVTANNQISANGNWGSVDTGLYAITTSDPTHVGFGKPDLIPPTIDNNSFTITYASGVVNEPNQTDTFKFHYDLGTQDLDLANTVLAELDAIKLGSIDIDDSKYWLQKEINGIIRGPPVNGIFSNSPNVYVPNIEGINPIIPEPNTLLLFSLLCAGAVGGRRRNMSKKEEEGMCNGIDD